MPPLRPLAVLTACHPTFCAAPLSQSKGPGIDIHPLMFTYPAGGNDVAVHIYDSDFAAAAGLADYVAQVRLGWYSWLVQVQGIIG